MIPFRSGRFKYASVIRSPIFLYHSWTAMSWPRSKRRALPPHPVLGRNLRLQILDHLDPLAAQESEGRLAPVDHEESVEVLLREHLVQWRRVEFRVTPIQERRDRLRRFQDERNHFRLVRADLLLALEDYEAARR